MSDEKWSDFRSVLKGELTVCHDGLDVGPKARTESNISPKILVQATQRVELLLTKLG